MLHLQRGGKVEFMKQFIQILTELPMGVEQFSGLGTVGIRQGLQKPFGPGDVEGILKIIINAFQITHIEVFKV